jgi:D-alanine-D-alanine ligase
MKNIAVLFGGPSVEHDVSIITAMQVIKNINKEKYNVIPIYWTQEARFVYLPSVLIDFKMPGKNTVSKAQKVILGHKIFHIEKRGISITGMVPTAVDVVLPIFHGTGGEDGSIQGALEVLDIPYSGCSVSASAVGMDKVLFKAVMDQKNVKALNCLLVKKSEYQNEVKNPFPYPVMVKPVHLGSSIGVKKADNDAGVKEALDIIFELDCAAMIEPFLVNMVEINCSVLGDSESCQASVCEQPVPTAEVLTFADKYLRGGKTKGEAAKSEGMASLSRRVPAPIEPEQTKYIQETAVKIYKAVGCSGVARIDFMIDLNTKNIYVTEINTIPGSLSYYLWEASGISFADLIDKLIETAEFEYNKKKSLLRTYESNLLV